MTNVWSIDPGLRQIGFVKAKIDESTETLALGKRVEILFVGNPDVIPRTVPNVTKLTMKEWSSFFDVFFRSQKETPDKVLIEQQRGGQQFSATKNLMIQAYITGYFQGMGIPVIAISPQQKFTKKIWYKIGKFDFPKTRIERKALTVKICKQLKVGNIKADAADAYLQLVVFETTSKKTTIDGFGLIE
jgi:hypothetical protein